MARVRTLAVTSARDGGARADGSTRPRGAGSARSTASKSATVMSPLASGSRAAQRAVKRSMSAAGTVVEPSSSSAPLKFSRITAMTRLRKTKKPASVKATKKGTAAHDPQVPAASEQRSGYLLSRTMQSCMRPFQLSPVTQRKSVRSATPKVRKLANSLRKSPSATRQKSCTPSTAKTKSSSSSRLVTLSSDGRESTMVVSRARRPRARLMSRRMRPTRMRRSTRRNAGLTGTRAESAAAPALPATSRPRSRALSTTRAKSKQFHAVDM
mmetsp:Transcript_16978/g.49179  ORF Transcript_16978/g.49179 Transcript_16978/m.49179 type:complete len:269 (-) Transcript_16978:374-1180(-)